MTKRRIVKTAFVVGLVGLLLLPALVYTQVTGRVLNPRLRTSYPSLSAAVAAAGPNDTLLVSGTLSGANAILDSATDTLPTGLKIVAGRGLRGTLQVTAAECAATTNNAILDVSDRDGAVTIMGLKLVVPNSCIGVFSDGTVSGGDPLTVRNLLIQRATSTASIAGILLAFELDGPFLIEGNTIPSVGSSGLAILVVGDGASPIQATVKGNRVGSANQPTQAGIAVADAPAGSVLIERNIVDGGNHASSVIGIGVVCPLPLPPGPCNDDVTVQRNTVRNFNSGVGIGIEESTNVTVSRNVIANNATGVVVEDGTIDPGETADTVAINFNNITSTVTGAIGVQFFPDSAATDTLDATNNWWGGNRGPRDVNADGAGGNPDDTFCPERVDPPACTTPQDPGTADDGNGLLVDAGAGAGAADCDVPPPAGTAGLVTTCPFRTSPVSPAGA